MLKAPFPWFGGKSRVAHLIWKHFGNVPNYVEPFAGSLAVLLGRPTPAKTETINDADCYLSNFWRALAHDPEGVAHYADWPVNECDLLDNWHEVAWKAAGGFGSQGNGQGRENCSKERIYFSPHCHIMPLLFQ